MGTIEPFSMPHLSWITLAIGARQLVVQEAFEMMLWWAAMYLSSFTPSTMVMSSPVAGAEMMTFLTEPRRWALAASALVKKPVDSTTIWAPRLDQSISAGFLMLKTLMDLPLTRISPSPALTSACSLPSTESYLSKCARVLVSVRSFVATISMPASGFSNAARNTLRPIRPKPLIATLIAIQMILSERIGIPNN